MGHDVLLLRISRQIEVGVSDGAARVLEGAQFVPDETRKLQVNGLDMEAIQHTYRNQQNMPLPNGQDCQR